MPRLILPTLALESKTPLAGRFSFAPLFVVMGAIAFLGGWLAPNHYLPWVSFHAEAASFAALLAFCAACLADKKNLLLDRAPLVFGALITVVWLQWAGGQIAYHGDATVSSLYLAGLAFAWWLGTNSAGSTDEAHKTLIWVAALLVLAAVVSLFIALLQWQGMEARLGTLAVDRVPNGRPFGNLGQPNHFATLMLMAIVMSSALYVLRSIKTWQWVTLVAFLSFGLVMAESRAGWVSALVLGLFFLWRGKREWGLGNWRTIAAWWGGLMLLSLSWKPLNEALLLQATRAGPSLAQDSARFTIWSQMLAAIQQAPWLGYGWRQTVVAQKAGANVVQGTLPTDYAHSVILDVLLWLGIPLGMLVLMLVGWWFLKAARKIEGPTQFLLLAGTLPVAVHSLVEFPFVYAYFLFPVGWMLGALSRLQSGGQQRGWTIKSPRARGGAALCVMLVTGMCAWVALEYFQAEEDHRVMRFEMRRVGKVPAGYEAPPLVLLNQLGELLRLARLEPYPGMPAQDLERMRVANASFEWATLQLRYAIALGLNGRPEEASLQLRSLRALYGERSYQQALGMFLDFQNGKYPQLQAVKLP